MLKPDEPYFLFIEGAHHGSFTGKIAETGAGRLLTLTPEQRERLRERLQARQSSSTTKDSAAASPKSRTGRGLTGRPGGAPGDQKAIFEWVKQATTAFWDASLKHDAPAKAWLESDSLSKLSHGAARLERK